MHILSFAAILVDKLTIFVADSLCAKSHLSELRATETKMLRVAVSSFYDYLQVVLKTFQEFEYAT